VFFLLRAGNMHLRERVRSTLEIESGSNDPIAIFLTITLVEVIAAGADPRRTCSMLDVLQGFVVQMVIGAAVGIAGGMVIVRLVERLHMDQGLMPIFVLTLALMLFGLPARWCTAPASSPSMSPASSPAIRGMRAVSMLQAFPGRHFLAGADHHVPGARALRHAVAVPRHPACRRSRSACPDLRRPAARGLALPAALPLQRGQRDGVHLLGRPARRGVDPAGADADHRRPVESGRPSSTSPSSSCWCRWSCRAGRSARRQAARPDRCPTRIGAVDKVELELPGSAHHELLAYRVAPAARWRTAAHPALGRPSLVMRDGYSHEAAGCGAPAGRRPVYIFVSDRYPRLLDRLFASRAELARTTKNSSALSKSIPGIWLARSRRPTARC
jgi:cell volume regulation protein A